MLNSNFIQFFSMHNRKYSIILSSVYISVYNAERSRQVAVLEPVLEKVDNCYE